MTGREQPHHFVWDPTIPGDHRGRWTCRCGAKQDNELHLTEPMAIAPEAAELDARVLGERPEVADA